MAGKQGKSKRGASESKKLVMARSHVSAKARHQAAGRDQGHREAANRKLRAEGKPTPWESACAARKARRQGVQRLV